MKQDFIIRSITENDGQNVVDMMNLIDKQTTFLLFEVGERPTTPERIKELAKSKHENVFVAENEQRELLGYILIFGSTFNRKKHVVEIILGVREEYRGQGIGTALINHAEKFSRENGISRVELTCSTSNPQAYKLYKRLGYHTEGLKKKCRKVNGNFRDDYMMAKFI